MDRGVLAILRALCIILFTGILLGRGVLPAGAGVTPDYEPLREELSSYLDGRAGFYALSVTDLRSGLSFGYNAREPFHGASTFKVPLNLYLFNEIAAGRVDPAARLVYRAAHYEAGTGVLQAEDFGTVFSIGLLSRYSLVYSDNVATNMLLGYLGRSNVINYMRELGGAVVSDRANVTCADDLVLYFGAVREFAREHPEHGRRLLGHLRNTVHRDRLPAPLPPGTSVAHKIGNWPAEGSWHDAGIVEHPVRPYIIAVLSKNTPSYAYACATIREVSRRVWDFQDDPFYRLTVHAAGAAPVELPGVLNREGRFLVPVRGFVNLLPDCGVQWVPEERAVLVFRAGRGLLRLEEDDLIFHGGRTYLPLRRLGEELGYRVHWDAAAGAVYLDVPQPVDTGPADPDASPGGSEPGDAEPARVAPGVSGQEMSNELSETGSCVQPHSGIKCC